MRSDGYIVTNLHVVQGVRGIRVNLPNGDSYDASIVGGDVVTDLAVLKIDPIEALGEPFAETAKDLVLVKDIEFFSSCPHHLMPYQGRATIAYVPDGLAVGFSGVVRLLDAPDDRRPSVGVVTFSMAQQRLIEDLVDELIQRRQELERFFSRRRRRSPCSSRTSRTSRATSET